MAYQIAFYMSIASTLVSFTTGHFFIFKAQLKFVSSTSYIVTYLLVTMSSMAVFPLFFHLMWATFKKVPQRKYRATIPHWLYLDEWLVFTFQSSSKAWWLKLLIDKLFPLILMMDLYRVFYFNKVKHLFGWIEYYLPT